MVAYTKGRIHRLATEQGWRIVCPHTQSLHASRHDTVLVLTFNRNGELATAMRYRPGECDHPKRAKFAHVRGWLTEEDTDGLRPQRIWPGAPPAPHAVRRGPPR